MDKSSTGRCGLGKFPFGQAAPPKSPRATVLTLKQGPPPALRSNRKNTHLPRIPSRKARRMCIARISRAPSREGVTGMPRFDIRDRAPLLERLPDVEPAELLTAITATRAVIVTRADAAQPLGPASTRC